MIRRPDSPPGIPPRGAQNLGQGAVAQVGADEFDTLYFQGPLQAQVAYDRGGDGVMES
jgi:hypothetical protein